MKLKKRLLAVTLALMMVSSVAMQPLSMVSATSGSEPQQEEFVDGEKSELLVITNATLNESDKLQVVTQGSQTEVLKPKLNVTYEDGSTDSIDVTWTADTAFDINTVNTYNFTASVDTEKYTLSDGVILPNFTVEVKAVEEDVKAAKIITEVAEVAPVSFTVGEDVTSVDFPSLAATLEDMTTENIDAIWTAKDVGFTDTAVAGIYVYTASLIDDAYKLLEGVTLPDFTVEVKDVLSPETGGDEEEEETTDATPPKQKAAPAAEPITLVFDLNVNGRADENEKTMQVSIDSTIAQSEIPAGFEEAVWYYPVSGGDGYGYFEFAFGDSGTTIFEDMKNHNDIIALQPYWMITFDTNVNGDSDESDYVTMMPNGEQYSFSDQNRAEERMAKQPTGWKICNTDDRVVFQGPSREGVSATVANSNSFLCPLFETQVYFYNGKTVPNYISDLESATVASGFVNIDGTISPSTPSTYGGTIGNVWDAKYLEENFDLLDFEGWYTAPNGGGTQWISGSTVVSESHVVSLLENNETAKRQDVIILYPKAVNLIRVNLHGEDSWDDITTVKVREGERITRNTLDIYGVALGDIVDGVHDEIDIGTGEIFAGFRAIDSQNNYIPWSFDPATGTIVDSSYAEEPWDDPYEINLYAVIQADDKFTIDFDLDGDGLINKYGESDNQLKVDKDVAANPSVEDIPVSPEKWVDQNNDEFTFGVEGTVVDENKILTPYYKVDFKNHAGTVEGEGGINPPETIKVGEKIEYPKNPDLESTEDPKAWYVDKNENGQIDGGEEWNFEEDIVTENITLIPFWGLKVTFDADGDGEIDVSEDGNDGIVYVGEGDVIDEDHPDLPDGYWDDRFNFEGIRIDPSTGKWLDKNGDEFILATSGDGSTVLEDKELTLYFTVEFKEDNEIDADTNITNPNQDVIVFGKVTAPQNNPQEEKGDPDLWYRDGSYYFEPDGKAQSYEVWNFDNDVITGNTVLTPFWGHEVIFDINYDGEYTLYKDQVVYVKDGEYVYYTDITSHFGRETWVDENGEIFELKGEVTDGTAVERDYIVRPAQEMYVFFDDLEYSSAQELIDAGYDIDEYIHTGIMDKEGDVIDGSEEFWDQPGELGTGLLETGEGLGIEPGKELKGWYTGPNGTGLKFEFDEYGTVLSPTQKSFDFDNDGTLVASVVLYPYVITTGNHVVGFDLDGDGNSEKNIEVETGATVNGSEIPYTETTPVKWVYKDDGVEKEFTFDEGGTEVEMDILLTPVYTVQFEDGNGNVESATGTNPPQEKTAGETVDAPVNPDKGTPEFWYVDENVNGKYDEGDKVWTFETDKVTNNITLIPYIKHTVGFDLDGDGTADPEKDVEVETGTPVTEEQVPNTTTPTPPKGWVDEDGNEVEINKTPITENEVLRPVYEVKFEDGKGNIDTTLNKPQEKTVGEKVEEPKNNPTDGTIDFWYIDSNDNGKYDSGEKKWNFGTDKVTENITLTPQVKYTVSFETTPSGNPSAEYDNFITETVVSGNKVAKPTTSPPSATDGTFVGWQIENPTTGQREEFNFNDTVIEGNISLYPYFEYDVNVTNTYNISDNGSGTYGPGDRVTINAGSRSNYTFTGWTISVGSVTLASPSSAQTSFVMPNGSLTITANWRQNATPVTPTPAPDEFTLTVEDGTGDGTYEEGDRVNVSHDDTQTPEGQEFVGWDTDGDGEVDVEDEDFIFTMPGENTVIRPVYEDIEEEFDLTVNDGSGTGTYVPGTRVPISHDETKTPEGQEFVGWDTDGDGEVDVTDKDFTFTMPDENTTISPVYEDIEGAGEEFELTVNGGDGDGTYAPGEEVDVTLGTVPEGQEFVGWDTDGDGEVDVTDENFIFTMPDENTVITAMYESTDDADKPLIDGDGGITIPPTGDGKTPENVTVDGNELGENDYTIGENGEIILSPDFIATLPNGEHIIGVEFDGEYYESTIIVEEGAALSATPFRAIGGAWSLFDLIMTVVAILLAIIYLAVRPKNNENQNEYAYNNDEEKHKKRIVTSLALFLFAMFSVVLLLLTQDFTKPMIIFDIWSIIFALVALIQVVVMFFVRKKNDEEDRQANIY